MRAEKKIACFPTCWLPRGIHFYMKPSQKDGVPLLKRIRAGCEQSAVLGPCYSIFDTQGPTWKFQHIHASCKVYFKRLEDFYKDLSLLHIFPSPGSTLLARKIPINRGPTGYQAGFQSLKRCSLHGFPESTLDDTVPERGREAYGEDEGLHLFFCFPSTVTV